MIRRGRNAKPLDPFCCGASDDRKMKRIGDAALGPKGRVFHTMLPLRVDSEVRGAAFTHSSNMQANDGRLETLLPNCMIRPTSLAAVIGPDFLGRELGHFSGGDDDDKDCGLQTVQDKGWFRFRLHA